MKCRPDPVLDIYVACQRGRFLRELNTPVQPVFLAAARDGAKRQQDRHEQHSDDAAAESMHELSRTPKASQLLADCGWLSK